MVPQREETAAVAAWLLDKATPEESVLIEDRMFADDGFYSRVRALEDELIRDYLCGALPSADRAAFEQKYFSTEPLRAKVEFLRSLKDVSAQVRSAGGESERRAFSGLRRAAVCVAAAAAVLLISIQEGRILKLRGSMERLRSVSESSTRRRMIASFTLFPGVERGKPDAAAEPLFIPDFDGDVRLILEPGRANWTGRYRVVIEKPEGGVVYNALAAPDADRKLHILAPAASLAAGDYILTADDANGGPAHESYSFRIARR